MLNMINTSELNSFTRGDIPQDAFVENVKFDYMAAICCPRFRTVQQDGKDGSLLNLNFSVHSDTIHIPEAMMKFNECSTCFNNSVGNIGHKSATRVYFTSEVDE